jgi:hypothetical protein
LDSFSCLRPLKIFSEKTATLLKNCSGRIHRGRLGHHFCPLPIPSHLPLFSASFTSTYVENTFCCFVKVSSVHSLCLVAEAALEVGRLRGGFCCLRFKMKTNQCARCKCLLRNAVYGSFCEDCWAERQPETQREVVRFARSGRRGSGVDSEAQYENGLRGWRWIDIWARRGEEGT